LISMDVSTTPNINLDTLLLVFLNNTILREYEKIAHDTFIQFFMSKVFLSILNEECLWIV
jgi:hypothetical protein